MNVVMLSPGFPLEMAYFTRALAQTGATVTVTSTARESRHTDESRAPLAPTILTPAQIVVLAE